MEYAVYGALSLSDEAAADAVREDMPESKKRAFFSWDLEAAAPSKQSTSAPVEEHTSVFCEEYVAAKEPASFFCEETTAAEEWPSVEEPPSVFCEAIAAASAAVEEPNGRTTSAPAEDPPSVAHTVSISIHFKEAISIAIAEFAPISNAEPTSALDTELASPTKECREGMRLENGKVMYVIINAHPSETSSIPDVNSALPENEQSQTRVGEKKAKKVKKP